MTSGVPIGNSLRVNRRRFLGVSGVGLASAALPAPAATQVPSKGMDTRSWYKTAYRRNVIDMHIADWDDEFLSKFDPDQYVNTLSRSQVQSAVVYAHSHVGLCNFPTKVGRTHRAMEGKDHLARTIYNCHQSGIAVVLYASMIHDLWAFQKNPDWRITLVNGEPTGHQTRPRFGLVCPNSPYRDYATALVQEICEQFDFEGIRFDMTYWPTVCFCRHCRNRFAEEVGGTLPTVIDWEDTQWVAFQRRREAWLAEFTGLLTSTVKSNKPDVSVEHQASGFTGNWVRGVSVDLAQHNDFLQGDFYGDALQGSFVRKFFYNLSKNLPYAFETSVMVHIVNHTAKKSEDLLRTKAFASLGDGGAFVFIDAVDPVGTLNPTVYEHMRKIFDKTKVYEPYLGGELCQDVGIYLSTESKCDFADNGKTIDSSLTRFLERQTTVSKRMPHVEAALAVCQACRSNHIPFGVITRKNLSDLRRHKVLVLPNVLMMDESETIAIREFVRNGGRLYASKFSSLITSQGKRKDDFLLSDVFGVSYEGETEENYTYLAPSDGVEDLFSGYSREYPLGLEGSQLKIDVQSSAQILGTLVLPYTDPRDMDVFASIHSNPPGRWTDQPALVMNEYGKGKSIYVAGDLENGDLYPDVVVRLLQLLSSKFCFEADAPSSVEVTQFVKSDSRILLNLVNFQAELPNLPVEGIRIRVRTGGRNVQSVGVVPGGAELDFDQTEDYVSFAAPVLEDFLMLAVDLA